jgi:hypothetical protein
MLSPPRDPHDPLAAPTNVDAAGRSTPYGPHTDGTDQAAGGADSSPLDNQSTDSAKPSAERLRSEGKRPESDPARR